MPKNSGIHLHLTDMITPGKYKGMPTVELFGCVYERMIADLGRYFRAEQGKTVKT